MSVYDSDVTTTEGREAFLESTPSTDPILPYHNWSSRGKLQSNCNGNAINRNCSTSNCWRRYTTKSVLSYSQNVRNKLKKKENDEVRHLKSTARKVYKVEKRKRVYPKFGWEYRSGEDKI